MGKSVSYGVQNKQNYSYFNRSTFAHMFIRHLALFLFSTLFFFFLLVMCVGSELNIRVLQKPREQDNTLVFCETFLIKRYIFSKIRILVWRFKLFHRSFSQEEKCKDRKLQIWLLNNAQKTLLAKVSRSSPCKSRQMRIRIRSAWHSRIHDNGLFRGPLPLGLFP